MAAVRMDSLRDARAYQEHLEDRIERCTCGCVDPDLIIVTRNNKPLDFQFAVRNAKRMRALDDNFADARSY
jgi:hypothetical protein